LLFHKRNLCRYDEVMCLAELPRGGLVSGGNDKVITVWRPEGEDDGDAAAADDANGGGSIGGGGGGGGMVVACHTVSPGAVRALAVTADGCRLFTAGADKNIRAWDISRPARGIILLKAFKGGHDGFVTSIALLPSAADPRFVVSGSEVGLYKLNSVYPQLESARFQPLNLECDVLVSNFTFKFSLHRYTEGKAGGFYMKGDGGIKVWRARDGQCVHTVSHQEGDITAFQVSRHRTRASDTGGSGAGSSAEAASGSGGEREVAGVMSASKDGTVVEWRVDWKDTDRRRGGSLGGSHNIKWSTGFLTQGK
jgi:WD40 repeat protein